MEQHRKRQKKKGGKKKNTYSYPYSEYMKGGDLLITWAITGFLRRTLFCGVCYHLQSYKALFVIPNCRPLKAVQAFDWSIWPHLRYSNRLVAGTFSHLCWKISRFGNAINYTPSSFALATMHRGQPVFQHGVCVSNIWDVVIEICRGRQPHCDNTAVL